MNVSIRFGQRPRKPHVFIPYWEGALDRHLISLRQPKSPLTVSSTKATSLPATIFPRPLPNVWNATPTSFTSNAKSSTKTAPLPPHSHTPITRPSSPTIHDAVGPALLQGVAVTRSVRLASRKASLSTPKHPASRNSQILRRNLLRHSHCSRAQVHRHVALQVARVSHGDQRLTSSSAAPRAPCSRPAGRVERCAFCRGSVSFPFPPRPRDFPAGKKGARPRHHPGARHHPGPLVTAETRRHASRVSP